MRKAQKIAEWYRDRETRDHVETLEATVAKEKRSRLHRFACEECGITVYHAGTDPRGWCYGCHENDGVLRPLRYAPMIPRAKMNMPGLPRQATATQTDTIAATFTASNVVKF